MEKCKGKDTETDRHGEIEGKKTQRKMTQRETET
jgi:hypothetical protein